MTVSLVRALRGWVALWVLLGFCGVVSAQTQKPATPGTTKVSPRRKTLSRKDQLRLMARAATYYENYKLLLKDGNRADAREALFKIVRMDPFPRESRARRFLAMTYVSLVDLLIREKKLDEAWTYANQGMKRTVRNPAERPSLEAGELFKMMGRIKALQGDTKAAMQFNRQAGEILERLDR